VKCPSSFRIKSKSHQLPIVIGPCSPENWQQADLNVRLHFLFRYAMQFSKSQDGNEVPGQGTSGGLTWAPRGRTLGSGCRRSGEMPIVLSHQKQESPAAHRDRSMLPGELAAS